MDLSPVSLLASLLVSTVGFSLFIYGKKQLRLPQLATGIALMVYPYFVAGPLWVIAMATALVLGLWLAVQSGL